jgi:acetolactate synthase-1/2/3 large subunit
MDELIKISDFVADFIAEHPDTSKTVFMVSGGGNMHLIDSLGKNEKLEYICNHHEQACAIAAEGYARVSNQIGIAYVTTGPGGTNAITGVYGAWVDSIPVMIISGQVKLETTISSNSKIKLRQLGDQEINIIDLIKSITKYSIMVTDKNQIKYHLQKAVYEAKNGRPGPVWLDIPLDIQNAIVSKKDLIEFTLPPKQPQDTKAYKVIELLKKSQRPIIICGNGITLSGANNKFLRLVELLKVPIISTFARYDIVKTDNKYFFGRYGTVGNRMANFIVQNADLIIAVGARLNIRAISYNWEFFGREAKKVVVDIDENELNKQTLQIDLKINCDAKIFIEDMINKAISSVLPSYFEWLDKCNEYKSRYPTIDLWRKKSRDFVDSYNFYDVISDLTKSNAIYIFGNGTACVSSYQSLRLYKNQKVVVNSGCASMGYDIPAAIGACYANDKQEILCITGEGSLQMNIQELQTIIHNKLPIKMFVFNNGGYISIKNTQNNFFKGYKVGSDAQSGVSFPDIVKVARAYGFKSIRIKNQIGLKNKLKKILDVKGSCICEIMLSPVEKMEPKLSSEVKPDGKIVSKPLEDMYPFLDRDEFRKNMLIRIVDE